MVMPKLPTKATMTTYVYELSIGDRYLIGNRANPTANGYQVEAYKIYVYPSGDITVDLEGRPLLSTGAVNEHHPRMIVVDPDIEADIRQQFEAQS